MADLKISALSAVTSPLTTDVLPIVSSGTTKKVTVANLVAAAGAITGTAGTDDNGIPRADGTSGLLLQTSGWTISDSGGLNPKTDGGGDIGNGASDPRDISLKRNVIMRGATSGLITLGATATGGGLAIGTGPTTLTDAAGKVLSTALNTVAVAQGGTGLTSFTAHNVLTGGSAGTALGSIAPGTSGNVLTSNGTDWTSAAPGAAGIGGSTGAVDNAILRADGTGGATVQSSGATIDDTNNIRANKVLTGGIGDFFGDGSISASGNIYAAQYIRTDGDYRANSSIVYSSGTPSIAGNGTLNANSRDSAGKVTSTGTGASTVVLTFSKAFTNAPACFVTNETTSNLVRPISTTTTLTFAATVVTGDSLSYICLGY